MRRPWSGHRAAAGNPEASGYPALRLVERPFLSSIQQPNFRSAQVSTDQLGFRVQYDKDGVRLDLAAAGAQYDSCDVLLGGSVAFGVGVTSDVSTLATWLSEPGVPCVNLGVRGATSQQELAAFLAMESSLPVVRRVVLLTGVNECVLAAHPVAEVHDVFGGGFLSQARAARPADLERPLDEALAGERLDLLLKRAAANVRIWGHLAHAFGFDVELVVQPVAGWTRKELSAGETAALDEEQKRIQSAGWIAGERRHALVTEALGAAAAGEGIRLTDANRWFDEATAEQTFFLDVCHLTDEGTRYLGTRLRELW